MKKRLKKFVRALMLTLPFLMFTAMSFKSYGQTMQQRLLTAQKEIKSLKEQVIGLQVQLDTITRDAKKAIEIAVYYEDMLYKYQDIDSLQRLQLGWKDQEIAHYRGMYESEVDIRNYIKKSADEQFISYNKLKKRSRIKTYIIAGLVGTIGTYIATK